MTGIARRSRSTLVF